MKTAAMIKQEEIKRLMELKEKCERDLELIKKKLRELVK